MDITELKHKLLKSHNSQVKLSKRLAKVGYDSKMGRLLRLKPYYSEGITMLKAWRDFLYIRKEHIGNTFFAVDHAIMHTDHDQVKDLMQVEPQLRGNDLGIIRILSDSYMLGNPLSLGTNGQPHTGIRKIFHQALPDPWHHAEALGNYVDDFLTDHTRLGTLHIGNDLPRFMVKILHHLVFRLNVSEEEVTGSRGYIKGLPLATLPTFLSKYLLRFKTGPILKHRKSLVQQYQAAPTWAAYAETGKQNGLTTAEIANGLFDMIHIAGTAGTSALMGSVIGVLCLNDALRHDVIQEINTVWDGSKPPSGDNLRQATLLHKVVLETARLYPPVRFVSQLATRSGDVTVGETKCPFQKGTRLLGSIFTANRDSQRYINPDDFSVDRDFSDLLSWNGHDHERVCPGQALSIELIKVFCMYLFTRYQWRQITEVKWDFEKVTAVTPNELELQGFAKQV
ncbi:cytochrome P450 [Leptothoe kymatousa]|uniref:Cytochrome P450 n=1 Tax=Leptothoe kymatousa TAU-MAC 1615 TaxID=2364775 RepID=A0ABS5Y366_9CYAN|nr:cytochrome P450 [Leptothoe kymatousa]MBT9312061.1 cytochrome P450 [Leptothoe kymatousa TAU-MAC 1615]